MLLIEAIPAFSDNYIWLLSLKNSSRAYVVDPGDAAPVLNKLKQRNLKLEGVLITHGHFDHIDGLEELQRTYNSTLKIIGPKSLRIPHINHQVTEGNHVNVLEQHFQIWETPGHTLDHIAYISFDKNPLIFCGDTLFAAGCGRLFEGTPQQMYNTLQRFRNLSDETLMYCGHEYTLNNLKFALTVEPHNILIKQRLQQTQQLLNAQQITIPSTIGLEKSTNPFLRVGHCQDIDQALKMKYIDAPSNWEKFATLRQWKDNF